MTSWVELEPVITQIGIYAILALSLNVICGMTGMLQLGQAGFAAIGAYAAGLTAIYCTFPELGFFNLFIGIAVAVTATGAASMLIGVPCLRLRGDYLAIATLGFGEIVRLTLNLLQFPGGKMFPGEKIGGCTGISFTEFPSDVWPNLPESLWGNNPELFARYSSWWVVWIFVIVTWIILLNIKKSSFGRAMMCIREDEIAAQSMGINIWKYKILAFLIGAAFAGLAGALFFHKEVTIAPSQFQLMVSIEILLMVVLGGLGSLTGSIGGAILLGITPFILRRLEIAEYTQLIYALLLIVLIRLMPNGILGMKEMPGWLSGKINSKKQRESS